MATTKGPKVGHYYRNEIGAIIKVLEIGLGWDVNKYISPEGYTGTISEWVFKNAGYVEIPESEFVAAQKALAPDAGAF